MARMRTTWRYRDPETGQIEPMDEYPYDEGPDAMDLAKLAREKCEANAERSLKLARLAILEAGADLARASHLPTDTPRDRLDRRARVLKALSRRATAELWAHDLEDELKK